MTPMNIRSGESATALGSYDRPAVMFSRPSWPGQARAVSLIGVTRRIRLSEARAPASRSSSQPLKVLHDEVFFSTDAAQQPPA